MDCKLEAQSKRARGRGGIGMLKCRHCGSRIVRVFFDPPDWYQGDLLVPQTDWAVCPKCGEIPLEDCEFVEVEEA